MSEATEQQDRTKTVADLVYDLMKEGDVGFLISYDELRAVGCDVRQSRSAYYAAQKRLLEERGLALKVVKRIGYQIVHPNTAPAMIKDKTKRAERQLARGIHLGQHVDKGMMTKAKAAQVDVLVASIISLQHGLRDVRRRQDFQAKVQAEQGQAIEELKRRTERLSDEEIDEFREYLRQQKEQQASTESTRQETERTETL